MRSEFDAFFPNLPQVPQAENLIPTAISQNRARPGNKFVQAAELSDRLVARAQEKMIGVAEDDPCVQRFQHFLRQSFDSSGSTDRHENWRLNFAVSRKDTSCS